MEDFDEGLYFTGFINYLWLDIFKKINQVSFDLP
jgi:hypothetical protein